MPIIGLTDREAQFPQIGSIRKGAPKPEDGKRPGADLKYFRAEFDAAETDSAAAFLKSYGAQPTELNILLPFNDIDRNFDAYYEAYQAGGLVYRSDGQRVLYEINPTNGQKIVVNGQPEKAHHAVTGMKATGRLKVIVPELGRAAFLVIHTTSVHDIGNLSGQLRALQQVNGGRLAGIPLKLRRRPVQISTPTGENGKRARREKWLMSVEADAAWVQKSLAAMREAALPQLTTPQVIESEYVEEDEDIFEGGVPEPPTPEEAWTTFIENFHPGKPVVRAALKTEKVGDWLAADDSRTIQDAIGLVQQQMVAA